MKETMEFIWYESPTIWAATIAGAFAIISGVVTILLFNKKNSIINKFNKDLANHKAELADKGKEIQSQLDRKSDMLRIEYGAIYSKRLDVIKELHEHFLSLKRYNILVRNMIKYGKAKFSDEDRKELEQLMIKKGDFFNYYESNKLYISSDLSKFIRAFYNFLDSSIATYFPSETLDIALKEIENSEETNGDTFQELKNIISTVQKTKSEIENNGESFEEILNNILELLQNEFRTLIGVK